MAMLDQQWSTRFGAKSSRCITSARHAVPVIQTGPIGHLKENANGILREVSALETVLTSQQFDVACIQETKLQLMVKTPEIPQYRAVRRDCQIHGEARGGGPCSCDTNILSYLSNCGNVQCAGEISNGKPIARATKNPGSQLVFIIRDHQLSTECRLLRFRSSNRTPTD